MGLFKRNKGSTPTGFVPIQYNYDYPQHNYQVKWNWPWPNVPAHEQIAALANCWTGNQLPGNTNFIPNVGASHHLWNVPTSYANSLRNQQYNRAFNIQGYSAVQNAQLMAAVQQAWQNRSGM